MLQISQVFGISGACNIVISLYNFLIAIESLPATFLIMLLSYIGASLES